MKYNYYNKVFLSFLILVSFIFSSSLPLTTASDSEVDDESPFSYIEATGKGPQKWGQLNPEWRVCTTGELQSPIDLLDERVKVFPTLGELNRNYKPAPAVIKNRGHDIMIEWKQDAGKINIEGTDYILKQCHWHTPSEHNFNGSRYDLELHIVHSSSSGKIAVIAILYQYGLPDPFLENLLPQINNVGRRKEIDLGIVNPGGIIFGSKKYYRYIGSLTTPPCTEGVVWTIIKKVGTVSMEQVGALSEAVDDGFEANARPIQQIHGRPILLYNSEEDGDSA